MKAETCSNYGVRYWAYILIYVDYILCVNHDPGTPLAKLDEYFKMKEGSVGSRTRDRAKAELGLVKKIADPAIFNQSSGKSVSIFPCGSRGPGKTLNSRSLLHLTSKG
jgi:hypothetical protein